jgi:site-specific recombinase XerC
VRRGARVTVEPGIYRDAGGYEVTASHTPYRGGPKLRASARYSLNTPRSDLRIARGRLLAGLKAEAVRQGDPGTLTADVRAYLSQLPAGRMRDDTAMLLAHWVFVLGDRPRAEITASDIRTAMSAWLDAGKAPGTVNKRRTALRSLYTALDGAAAANPVREVRKLHEAQEARDIPPSALAAILAELPVRTAKGRWWRSTAHLRVMAATGWPPRILAQITDADLHLAGPDPYAIVKPRAKGAGQAGKAVPLTPEAVEALTDFRAAKAWGAVPRNVLRLVFLRAVEKAKAKWVGAWPVPDHVSPYWLRHAFGTRVLAASGDLAGTAEVMLHGSLASTQRYTRSAVTTRARATIQRISTAPRTAPREFPSKKAR